MYAIRSYYVLHLGDVRLQTRRMVRNIAALLEAGGASLAESPISAAPCDRQTGPATGRYSEVALPPAVPPQRNA